MSFDHNIIMTGIQILTNTVLGTLQHLTKGEQITRVNLYMNEKNTLSLAGFLSIMDKLIMHTTKEM